MPRFAANLSMLFTEVPFLERFERAANAGFEAVEFLFPYDYPVADVTRWLKENNLKSALFNMPPGDWAAGERGMASIPGREDEFLDGVDKAIEYALSLGTPTIHAMAGMVPEGAATDIRSQTQDVLAQIDTHLAALGSDKTRLLRVQIYLADIADIGAMNEVWDAWVAPGHAPPRATVQAALADPAWKIEVVATAAQR